MVNEELRKNLAEVYKDEELLLFDNPAFDNSIIGVDEVGHRVVYDFYKMAEELAHDDNCGILEAIEFIDYNTVRSLAYCENAPILVNSIDLIL